MELNKIHLSTGLSFEPPLFAEKEALGSALSNILDNAIKFTLEGGNIIVEMHSLDRLLKISITNSFKKLPDEDLNMIFEAFYRTEKTSATGSGLGLAIARKNIERHGGSICARNTEDGLQIEIDLPTGQSEA